MSPARLRWRVFEDPVSLAAGVADVVESAAARALGRGDEFLLVLAGGTTPKAVYARLAAASTTWERWQVYFGDERCLPAGHADRNDAMAREAWLDRVPIPAANVHAIPAELGAERAARRYGRTLAGVRRFDLTLLGIGEDGHTASLFPGRDTGHAPESPDALPVSDAPKPPPDRVTISARRLGLSRRVAVIAAGAAKREALTRLARGEDLPVARIRPPRGIELYVDREALPAGADGE